MSSAKADAMTLSANAERDLEQACRLLQEYSFDLGGYLAEELVSLWQKHLEAEPSWVRAAVLEALYQGRYKAFSVEQILRLWKRRGHPMRHYNHDFERMVMGPMDPGLLVYTPPSPLPWSPDGRTNDPPVEAMEGDAPPSGLSPNSDVTARVVPEENLAVSVESAGALEVSHAPMPRPALDRSPTVAPEENSQNASPAAGVPANHLGFGLDMPTASGAKQADPFSHPAPIQTFEPMTAGSGFYYRLEAIARQYPS